MNPAGRIAEKRARPASKPFFMLVSPRVVFRSRNKVLVREWPEPQLFLGDLPQARKAQRFDDQEKDDERAEQDQGEVGYQPRGKGEAERALDRGGREVHEDRQKHDESRAEERAQDAADPADDDHEEDPEGKIELETRGLYG